MNTVSKGLFEKISRQKADIQFVDYLYEAGDVFYFGINNHVYGYSPDMEKSVFESYVRSIKDPVILMGFLVENSILVDFERSDFCPLMESLYIGKKTSLSESEDVEDEEGEPEEESDGDSEDETEEEDDAFFSDEDEEESEYSQAYGTAYTEGFEDAVSGKENRYEAEAEDSESSDSESDDSENEESEEEAEEMEESFTGSDQSAGGLGYGGLGEEQYPGEDLAVEPVYKESEESDEDAEDTDPDFTDETPDDEEPYPEDENMSETEMGERDGYEDGYADGLIFSQEMSDEGEEDEETEEIDAEDEGEITEGLTIPDPSAPQKLLLRTLLKAMDQEPRDHARLTPMIGSNVPSGYPRVSNAMWQSLSRSQLAKKDQGGWYLTQRGADTLTDEKEVTESKKRTSKNTNLHESSEKRIKKGVKEAFEDDEFEEEDDADDEAILGMLSEQEAIEVFCDFLECDPYEIEASWEDERGDWHFVIDNQEYLVNQDREVLPLVDPYEDLDESLALGSRAATLKLMDDPDIRKLLDQATRGHFQDLEVDDRGYVNYQGDIDLSGMRFFDKIPVPFGTVGGYFHCIGKQLRTLEGAPTSVGGEFDCSENQLTSLEGAPSKVDGSFYCHKNQLRTLAGAPKSVGLSFFCHGNQLRTLVGAPTLVGGSFYCNENQLQSLKGAPTSVGRDFNCSDNPDLTEDEITRYFESDAVRGDFEENTFTRASS